MSLAMTMLLGLIAGVTILIGMPLGRLRRPAPTLRLLLNSIAVGILMFLFWDVMSAAWEPIDTHLASAHAHDGGALTALWYGLLLGGGLAAGLLGLVGYDRYLRRRAAAGSKGGPGAMAVAERPATGIAAWSPARRMALMIAVGIGLHNFGEGLAIGQSAATGAIALATVLVIGFALHNATEGFGIVAPLAAEGDRPGWGLLLLLAAIGGGPTFVGTIVGHSFTAEPLSVLFLSLAAGSIVYVIAQLLGVAARAKRPDLVAIGLLIGLFAGFLTDAIVTMGGA